MRKELMIECLKHLTLRVDAAETVPLSFGPEFGENLRDVLDAAIQHVPEDPRRDGLYAILDSFGAQSFAKVTNGKTYVLESWLQISDDEAGRCVFRDEAVFPGVEEEK